MTSQSSKTKLCGRRADVIMSFGFSWTAAADNSSGSSELSLFVCSLAGCAKAAGLVFINAGGKRAKDVSVYDSLDHLCIMNCFNPLALNVSPKHSAKLA